MALDISGILDQVISHALATGVFDTVNGHEPKAAPGLGLTCAVWVDTLEPVLSSGLDITSARLVLNVRLYSGMTQEPQDAIDPNLVAALSVLFDAYIGDFTLGGVARAVDVRGADGQGLTARQGYLNQDGRELRVFTIILPIIVNDVWEEAA